MRDEEDRRAQALLQGAHELEDLRLHRHIERRRRLVGDEEDGVARNRLRDHRPLTLPPGQLVRIRGEGLLRIGKLDHAKQLDRTLLRGGGGDAEVLAERLDDLRADREDGFNAVMGSWKIIEI